MDNTRAILKNAFIDAQLVGYTVKQHTFSTEFETKMKRIIKYQKGVLRLINTTGKRIACIILTALICLTTVACSIEEVREPIIEEIKEFYVNAKELLTGTAADEVAELFPNDVSKIIGTSYVSKSKNQYVIDDEETVTKFIELLSETYWGEPEQFEDFEDINTYWTFDFYNQEEKSLFQIKMCNNVRYVKSKIAINTNGEEKHFYISNSIYKEILAFTNEKYYLHDSRIEDYDKEFFESQKTKVITDIEENEAKTIKKKIRNLHYEIEYFLLSEVSHLKEKDSIYWDYVISEEIFTDPINEERRKFDINRIMNYELEYIISTVKEESVKVKLSEALKLWNESVNSHDLEGLFKVHEYVHDYDYYAFNYPTHYVYSESADYQGLDDYFGHLE